MNSLSRESSEPLSAAIFVLRTGIDRLATLPGICEPAFLSVGDKLIGAVGALGQIQRTMGDLRERLTGIELEDSRRALMNTITGLGDFTGDQSRNRAGLEELQSLIRDAASRTAPLTRILGEINVLAVNARIEASHIRQTGVDFSVFTREIARLRNLAAEAVDRCGASLGRLDTTIQDARSSFDSFERDHATSINSIKARLAESLAQLERQDQQTVTLATAMDRRTQEITRRLTAAVSALQINDITMQRIGHVREALETLHDVATGKRREPALDGRLHLVAAAACRLQALQLSRAVEDFSREVAIVGQELENIAQTIQVMLDEARQSLAGKGERQGSSTVKDVETSCATALGFMHALGEAENRLHQSIARVTGNVDAMAGDISAIRSIETDMRIMGLNATFKCGRLGNEGRSLSVIAQELRSYSKRTGEDSQAIASKLTQATELGVSLQNDAKDRRHGELSTQEERMRAALRVFNELAADISQALNVIEVDGGPVTATLMQTARNIDLAAQVQAVVTEINSRLESLADHLDPERHGVGEVEAEVEGLLQQNYTMESERTIHSLFASGDDNAAHADIKATESVDEFFL